MGVFQPEVSHDSQSSSRSFALRWKQVNPRVLSLAGAASIVIALLILLYVHGASKKEIVLVIDGKVQTLETREALLSDVLAKEQISLQPHDELSIGLSDEIQDGDRVVITRAQKLTLIADGATKTLYTTEDSLGDAITKLGYSLEGNDKIFPSLDTAVTSDMEVKIVRITKQTVQRTVSLPFKVIKTADPSLYVGDVRVAQAGKPGAIIQHIEKIYQDGELASMTMVGKEVQTVTKDKVIAVGTKAVPKPVVAATVATKTSKSTTTSKSTKVSANNVISKAGVDFEYKKMIKNVSMTAYSSEEPGIGTKTASGTRVTEGRTIAVDPNVIPIGWWVYIEGLGFRRAEDTGGAIKGNKVDVYYDSLSHARNFGRKSRTVYVIGPVKPELN
ncbi:3D domain-containing protein [Paenibacillus sp. MMS20-IR301]|uniref:3D domain-containing protein n=1 Tax=Paenibacillus sp. MMS20-IR301 TaxID=2895946 RepID=UPI0028EB9624|nr:3D domain-containing protein [Paenibacillus sp. MMS20-IR301]WNS42207.1 3D domain-containing protein [Paenibacillus sp. MMS20-IR301]